MGVVRIPAPVFETIQKHLFSIPGEHFAFMLARVASSQGKPVFMVREAILIPDGQVKVTRTGWELTTEAILSVVNGAIRSGDAIIEAHNHGGRTPRFSSTDVEGLRDFSAYVLSSVRGRPYGATVWGNDLIYGEFFTPDGGHGLLRSVIVNGTALRQVISRDDDGRRIDVAFDRQLPWFTPAGQRMLGRFRVGVVGAGGTGSPVLHNLVYLGLRDFTVVDDDAADETSMNRLVTATAADLGTEKGILARRLIRSVAPSAVVRYIPSKLQSQEALDVLKGVDVLLGCVDNDGARLILNELALAYQIPYLDLAVGIDAEEGRLNVAGGRLCVVLPGGACLYCMDEIDPAEARFFLGTEEERAFQVERGYVRGMDVKAPAVVSLNAAVAAMAVNEFAVLVSGVRPVNQYTEFDLLGIGRPVASQWITPRRVMKKPDCIECTLAGVGDSARIERYVGVENSARAR
jgi:molybdopterin/thiamine biosynthesis adenylyltransferase